jgi:hypothetical protein
MSDDSRHPLTDEVMRSLGKIEGTLHGIDDKLDRHHERLNAHGDRIHHVEKRGWFLVDVNQLERFGYVGPHKPGPPRAEYIAMVNEDEEEIGIAWITPFAGHIEATKMFGRNLYPEWRGKGYIDIAAEGIITYAFTKHPEILSMVAIILGTSPYWSKFLDENSDMPSRRYVGVIYDAEGPGVDYHYVQHRRADWEEHYCKE